jgi:gliding motility-associated-like protein
MKNYTACFKTGIFILFAFGIRNIGNAQCSFSVNAEVVQDATCASNGIVKVTLVGDEIDPSNVFITISDKNLITERSAENGHQFEALPHGTYFITANTVCKNTQQTVTIDDVPVVIADKYEELGASLGSNKRSSLECVHTGAIDVIIWEGRLPYTVKITGKPESYTGQTEFTFDGEGTFTFSDLAPGNYIFKVTDGCYERELRPTIDKITADFPADLYDDFNPSGCNQAYTYSNYTGHEYWESYRDMYEIAFTFDDTKDWQPTSYDSPLYFDLHEAYKTLADNNATMKVYLRLKDTECEQLVDEIFFNPPDPGYISYNIGRGCNNYMVQFWLSNEYGLCSPFAWEIIKDDDGTVVANAADVDYFGTQSFDNLEYNTNYTIKVTDKNGTELTVPFFYERNIPYLAWTWTTDYLYSYDLYYDVMDLCLPYKWEIFDFDSIFIKNTEGIDVPNGVIEDLEYDKEYIINMIDGSGDTISFHYKRESPDRYINVYPGSGGGEWSCTDYSVAVVPVKINAPYTWTVMKIDSTELFSGTDENNILAGLEYDSAYILKITDGISTLYYDINAYSYSSPTPWSWDYGDYDYQCDDYAFRFRISDLYCLPYKWEIYDSHGNLFDEKSGITDLQEQTTRLKYDETYTVKVIDSENRTFDILTWSRANDYNLNPYFYGWDINRQCRDYEYWFRVSNINCFPYKWEVYDSNSVLVDSKEGLTETGEHTVKLEYNMDYTIRVTDNNGKYAENTYRVNRENSQISFYPYMNLSSCYNATEGYIYMYGQFDVDTRIEFVSGPQIPIHADTVLEESTYWFYPFSENYRYSENVTIPQGEYVFKVTDKCGDEHEMTFSYVKSVEAKDVSYTLDEMTDMCNGITRLYPHGTVYNNGSPSYYGTYFVMLESPDHSSEGMSIVEDPSSYFQLSKNGKYVIGVREGWWGDCPVDTIVINYVRKSIELEGRSSYVCETGSIGHIRVQAKNGKPPYRYTLLNKDSTMVADVTPPNPNNTGAFEYGAFGEKYLVQVEDECNTLFYVPVEISTVDQSSLLSGRTEICKGGSIEFSCLLLGATEYKWEGPLGFSANTRTVSIPNATTDHNGEYIVHVKPAGCNEWFRDTAVLTVHDTPMPELPDIIELCQAEADTVLSARPLNSKYSIQWYDSNGDLLTEEPRVDLNSDIRNYVFYATQTEDAMPCVSERKKIEVKINPLPEKNAVAAGWSCQDENPKITVSEIVGGYVYRVFPDVEATDTIMTFTGSTDTETLDLPATVLDDTVFYLQTATLAGCTLSPGTVEMQIDVDRLEMTPDRLPVYKHDEAYSVQLESNAEEPVFSYTGDLLPGITLTPDGLLSGTVPASEGYSEATFIATVTDKNGCRTRNEYTLRSCEPAPETVSEELSYCHNGVSVSLEEKVTSPNGFPLQWYNEQMEQLTEAPTPNTAVIGYQTFYVAQRNETLQCESAKAEIKVKITPLPELAFEAPDTIVCYGKSPVVALANLHDTYIYDIYSDAQMTEKLASVTGTTSGEVELPTVLEAPASYYILVTDSLNCPAEELAEVKAEVVKLELLPDRLPVYTHDEPYSVQLESNAEEPIFDYYGDFIPGIILSPDGLISGTIPTSEGYREWTFTATVTDKHDCLAETEYLLRSCEPAPEILHAELSYCRNAQAASLQDEASSPNGFPLQWYNEQMEELTEAPTPSTAVVGEQIFYVAQRNETLQCVGAKAAIKVTVTPLPELEFEAPDITVCHGKSPVVSLGNLHNAYIYDIYSDAQMTEKLASVTGTTSGEVELPTVLEAPASYYISVADNLNCSSEELAEVKAEVVKLELLPDRLPVYTHDEPYSVQLESNAEEPIFSYSGDFIPGIILSPDGLISGTIPTSEGYREWTFTATVTDKHNCLAATEYLLRSCEPAPEILHAELSYCRNAQAASLLDEASSPNGFPLQWYNEQMEELTEAPTPSTAVVGEQIFYVAQRNETLQCVGAKAAIKVTVTPLPELEFEAPDTIVCHGKSPVIGLANLHDAYIYDIYSDAQMTEKLASVTGMTSGEVELPTVLEAPTSYYILVTDNLNCSSEELAEVKAEVVKLELLPDRLPVYTHELPYSVQLESNAEEPVFSYIGALVTGITLTPDGLISGTVPKSAGREESTFTVTVTDRNKCEATAEYLLRTCEPMPELSGVTEYCESEHATPLEVIYGEGNTVQWYDSELRKLSETPTPNTGVTGEQIFYVSQINETLECESEKTQVSVTVNPAPAIDFRAFADTVCLGDSPSIRLENLHENYIYSIYPDNTVNDERGSLTGVDAGTVDLEDILESDTSYYIRVTDNIGCLSTDWMKTPVEVIRLYIEPAKLPQYNKNVDYEQRLITNAQSPVFTIYAGDMPEGLMMNAEGTISGKVPTSEHSTSNTFTVKVRDSHGCITTREYVLNGDVFIPKLFTPNGDGINDVFMQNYKVVIFDRLGIEMFRGDNGWDGTYDGKPVSEDIYFYKLEYTDTDGVAKMVTGYVGVHYGL